MSVSAISFILMALLLPVMAWCGARVGRLQDRWRRGFLIALAFGLLLLWVWLYRHPSVAVQIIPLQVLSRLEGIGAAPLFMFLIGVAWTMGELRRQRALVVLGGVIGMGYFLQGGLWMIQTTPTAAFAEPVDSVQQRQSQDYSCVPAACSTTLRIFGVSTSESEMARLTETRPGQGSTMIRAMNGLERRLGGSSIRPVLVEPTYDELLGVQPPFMVPLRYEARRLHMVTVVGFLPSRVFIADPATGVEVVSRQQFERLFYGQAIIFQRLDGSPAQPVEDPMAMIEEPIFQLASPE
ncbi:MAG: cysteine peptidase family C39 domain-containing protein [Planctomycetota bacterium]